MAELFFTDAEVSADGRADIHSPGTAYQGTGLDLRQCLQLAVDELRVYQRVFESGIAFEYRAMMRLDRERLGHLAQTFPSHRVNKTREPPRVRFVDAFDSRHESPPSPG